MNLLLLDTDACDADGCATLPAAQAHHVRTVLRATVGDRVRVGLVDGPLGIGIVSRLTADDVVVRCAFDASPPPVPSLDLLLALPRPKVLRRLLPQLTALGVRRLMLCNAARVERHYFDTHVLDAEELDVCLREGLQQARDTRRPLVTVHRQFRVLVEDHLEALVGDVEARLVAHPGAAPRISEALASTRTAAAAGVPSSSLHSRRVALAVGPEGGWTDFERALLVAHGFTEVSLGTRVLRSDTACLALVALAHDALRHA
mgnify:CR=1 FL=1